MGLYTLSDYSIISMSLIFPFLLLFDIYFFPRNMFLRCSRNSSLFFVLWYRLLRALSLFLLIVNSSVHHGTALCFIVFFVESRILNDLLHDSVITSCSFSTALSMSHVYLMYVARWQSNLANSSKLFIRNFIAISSFKFLSNLLYACSFVIYLIPL